MCNATKSSNIFKQIAFGFTSCYFELLVLVVSLIPKYILHTVLSHTNVRATASILDLFPALIFAVLLGAREQV